ncbi:MAG: CBS domain-containing protein [Bryobacteraceae bacterium]|jgi:CBS domain-containing protein
MARVRDITASRELFFVEPRQTVAATARRMAELHCGAILVLGEGELRGLFSERDLMLRVVLERRDPETTPVGDVMTRELATIDESASLEAAMEAMVSRKCRHLPVTREGRVTALLSMRDLMSVELALKTEELHHMRAFIQSNT